MRRNRIISSLIDLCIIGTILAICIKYVPEWFWRFSFKIGTIPVSLPSVGPVLFIIPFCFKDVVFRNASLGKKIMNLIIVDNEWDIPSIKTLMKRGILMPTWGYVTLIKNLSGNFSIENWEIDNLKTRVIDRNMFQKMKQESLAMGGNYKNNMDKLYYSMR